MSRKQLNTDGVIEIIQNSGISDSECAEDEDKNMHFTNYDGAE